MFRFFALSMALVLANIAEAADYVIKDETLVCDTEKTYRAQIKHLVDGNQSLIEGCDITMGEASVKLIDANATTPSQVEFTLTGRQVWVGNNGIVSK
jgi:glutathionylspermidine synthase